MTRSNLTQILTWCGADLSKRNSVFGQRSRAMHLYWCIPV
jgi:hypothetical protein